MPVEITAFRPELAVGAARYLSGPQTRNSQFICAFSCLVHTRGKVNYSLRIVTTKARIGSSFRDGFG